LSFGRGGCGLFGVCLCWVGGGGGWIGRGGLTSVEEVEGVAAGVEEVAEVAVARALVWVGRCLEGRILRGTVSVYVEMTAVYSGTRSVINITHNPKRK